MRTIQFQADGFEVEATQGEAGWTATVRDGGEVVYEALPVVVSPLADERAVVVAALKMAESDGMGGPASAAVSRQVDARPGRYSEKMRWFRSDRAVALSYIRGDLEEMGRGSVYAAAVVAA